MRKRADRTASIAAFLCISFGLTSAAATAEAYTHNVTPNGDPVRWNKDEIRIVVDDSVAAIAPVSAVRNTVRRAFETWIGEADLPMDFTVVQGSCGELGYHGEKDGENCVMACESCVPHGEDVGAKALVSHVLETGEIVDADIVLFSDAGDWSLGHAPGAISLEDVMLHEIGHVLGLGHSDIPEARMFSSISSPDQHDELPLHDDDVQGAGSLYPERAPEITTAGCGWRCSAASGTPGGIAGCLLFVVAAVLLGLRRR
jgi:hypothetical protein